MHDAKPGKLQGIQALRGVAALAVVAYHVARHLDQAVGAPVLAAVLLPGHAGVDLFFVLSGFIILHVHARDIGCPARLRGYVRQRFLRLMPIFWVALAATVAVTLAGGHRLDPGFVLWSAALLPTWDEPLLGVAWTLEHEAIFYVFFALLIAHRRLGLVAMGLWLGLSAAEAAGLLPALVPRIMSPFNLQFLFGMGAAWLVARDRLPKPGAVALAGLGLLIGAGVTEGLGHLNGHGPAARLAYGLPAALLIVGLAARERRFGMAVPRGLATLGEASYSLYLFQLLFMGIAWKAWEFAGLDTVALLPLCALVLFAAPLVGGLLAHRLVEAPLLAWLRGGYSWRSASIGFSAAARRAGK